VNQHNEICQKPRRRSPTSNTRLYFNRELCCSFHPMQLYMSFVLTQDAPETCGANVFVETSETTQDAHFREINITKKRETTRKYKWTNTKKNLQDALQEFVCFSRQQRQQEISKNTQFNTHVFFVSTAGAPTAAAAKNTYCKKHTVLHTSPSFVEWRLRTRSLRSSTTGGGGCGARSSSLDTVWCCGAYKNTQHQHILKQVDTTEASTDTRLL